MSSVDPGSKLPSENVHFVNIEDEVVGAQTDSESLFIVNDIVESQTGGVYTAPSNSFEIPVLPRGSSLVINIVSTWGVCTLFIRLVVIKNIIRTLIMLD